MYLMASVHAYDAIDRVHITTEVRSAPGQPGERWTVELRATTTIAGAGVTNPRDWLEDALIALLESL